jgi:hypothetical protein
MLPIIFTLIAIRRPVQRQPAQAGMQLVANWQFKKWGQRVYYTALRTGHIKHPLVGRCESCGCLRRLIGHHTDYRRALDVIWLCQSCHNLAHFGNAERDANTALGRADAGPQRRPVILVCWWYKARLGFWPWQKLPGRMDRKKRQRQEWYQVLKKTV